MAPQITVDSDGHLVLEALDEPHLPNNPDFDDIIIAFPTVTRRRDRIVLEVGDQVAEALDYMIPMLEGIGVHVSLTDELQDIVGRHQAELQLIQQLMSGQESESDEFGSQPPDVPGLLSTTQLLPHQVRGLRKALTIHNAAEFSVQGAGKTTIVLAAFMFWRARGEVDKLLVIGPASCFRPWEEEILDRLGPEVRTIRWSGSAAERTRLVPAFGESDVVLCTYDTARMDRPMLGRLLRSFRTLLVLDESHYIKNFDIGARGAAVLKLAPYATRRMILTGTPTPHSLEDLWTQFTFLWPSGARTLIGTRQQYLDFLMGSASPALELSNRLSLFFHRTTQNELSLPPAESNFPQVPSEISPPEQLKIIHLLEMRVLAEARLQLPNLQDRAVLEQWQRARIIRLLQAASNPGLLLRRADWSVNEVGDVDISDLMNDVTRFHVGELIAGKVRWTVDKARELVAAGHKTVIWTWWVENLHLLRRLLEDFEPLLLYGAIKPYEEQADEAAEQSRERNIREFKSRPDRPILLANPAACAEAISLHQQCHQAIYLDRTFNCGQFLQSLNRIHRVGLPPDLTTHYWIPYIDCAVERAVDARLQQRQRVLYEFLADDTPALGIDAGDESDVADGSDEMNAAFSRIQQELERDSQ